MSEQARLYFGQPEHERNQGRPLSRYDRFQEQIRATLETYMPAKDEAKGEETLSVATKGDAGGPLTSYAYGVLSGRLILDTFPRNSTWGGSE